ncbi:hypothetical protein [Clostridium sp. C8]|nr:hypothetical protein [Clostridium sp. C8]KLE17474.1 hypothetical protein AAT22_00635 [Clostridium sp. C8]
MSQLNKLYRNFIILQEDERGYSSSNDKTLSGYSKIEAKGDTCKISFYAQNLRNDGDDYCIMAICNKKDTKKMLDLGKITVSDGGKAEITKEYSVDDIAGLGISYDKISGAAIAKMKDEIPIIIMCGFINGEQPSDNWKNYKIIKSTSDKSKDKVEYFKKEDKMKKDYDKKKESDKKKDDDKKYYDKKKDEAKKKDEDKNKDEDKKKDENNCKCSEHREEDLRSDERPIMEEGIGPIDIEEQDVEAIPEDGADVKKNIDDKDNPFTNLNGVNAAQNPFVNSSGEINYYGSNSLNRASKKNKFDEYEEEIEKKSDVFSIKGSVGEYFEGIANGFEHCRNEYREIKYCKWYKIPVHDLHEMCNMSNYNRYTVAYYPMLNYYPYIRKYGHFMLGYKCDKDGNLRYIVYGIPGRKNRDEQPYEGKTGFVTWISNETRDGVGCWLMFYDFRNSTVVVPMK